MAQRGRKSAASLATLPVTEPKPARTRPRSPPSPPGHLSPEIATWWTSVVTEHDLDHHRLRLLLLCCESLDRIGEARAILAAEGLTYTDKNGSPRAHPATIIERDNKIAAGRLIKEMHLDPPPERHVGGIGWMPDRPEGRRPWDRRPWDDD
jgi:phage terminase small subunit